MTKIQLRRDTAANWSTNNPTPSAGEPCFETDTGKLKIGDGTTAYTQLAYFPAGDLGFEICDIGIALYVDESKGLRRYLNGQIVDINTNTQKFLNRLKEITTLHPSLLCTEEEWQTAKTMSAFGQVGKFVFNYSGGEVVSVRLPRVVNAQGLFDLQNLGMTVSAGLPNITGSISAGLSPDGSYTGAFTALTQNTYHFAAGDFNQKGLTFNASRSNPIYGNSDTVQQEAIQYPYFIQIATGSETENNIINDIELNNPYSLFDSKYSDHELNNLSWLKSEGQWNAKAVYTDAYNKLLKVYNGTETVAGLSVKLSTEEYTDYDFVLNTAEETFRLPLLDGSEDLLSDRYDNLTLKASGSTYIAPANGWFALNKDGNTAQFIRLIKNNVILASDIASINNQLLGCSLFVDRNEEITLEYNASGKTSYFRFIYAQGNGSLYFYVGETVQNANLIDAGRIGEQLADKVDLDAQNLSADGKSLIGGLAMPSDKYIDLTFGASGSTYTAPADGQIIIYGVSNDEQNSNHELKVDVNTNKTYCNSVFGAKMHLGLYFPVKKGDVYKVDYSRYVNTSFRFYYTVGSSPTA